MSGLDLKTVHEALADQIRDGIADAGDFTVKAFPSTSPRPCIEVWPDAQYVTYFGTFGAARVSEMNLVVRVFMSNANPESEWLVACRLLSAGTGHTSSIIDAVHTDATLDGAVDSTFIGDARWNPEEGSIDFPVRVALRNVGAAA